MKTVAVFGSTGSIGRNALKVIAQLGDSFKVVALTSRANAHLLAEQINEFSPEIAAIVDHSQVELLKRRVGVSTKLLSGSVGLQAVAGYGADITLMAIGGSAGLLPTLKSIESTKRLALANKEALVMAGDIVMQKVKEYGVEIIPIDSEHSAIFQCLNGEEKKSLDKIYLTCSGGPLREIAAEELKSITPDFALHHPRWQMGKKVSIDSATLMNKGLEVIEAHYLFGVPAKKIKVVIHPQALVHSLVQFIDGSILAQVSRADMCIPIQYALTYPLRQPSAQARFNFSTVRDLTFHLPDLNKFPCLGLAQQAAEQGGLAGAVLNASDEECVFAFLEGKIKIIDFAGIIEAILANLDNKDNPTLEEILAADHWAREQVKLRLERIGVKS